MPRIDVFDTSAALAAGAGGLFAALGAQAIRERGAFYALLSGGSTPRDTYRWLAAHGRALEWPRVHLFFGDERLVPSDDAESNYRMVRESLIDSLSGAGVTAYRVETERGPEDAAAAYERVMRAALPANEPAFDVVLLGLGDDAHTASLFPGTQAIHEREKWVMAHEVEALGAWRITVTPPVINSARTVVFLVSGEKKADAVHAVIEGDRHVDRLPAQVVAPVSGDVRWLLDRDAAKQLRDRR